MSRAVKIDTVKTFSGSAGGTERTADVLLRVTGKADTVEEVRVFVKRATAHHAALVEALDGLLKVMNDRTASGTNVDGKWMGIPDWDQVAAATALLNRVRS